MIERYAHVDMNPESSKKLVITQNTICGCRYDEIEPWACLSFEDRCCDLIQTHMKRMKCRSLYKPTHWFIPSTG